MQVRTDDEIYDVDASYLGPPGHYLGRIRYKTLLLFPAIFLPVLVLLFSMGVPMNLLTIGFSFLVCLRLNQLLGKHFSRMTPFSAVLTHFFNELGAPRHRNHKAEVSELVTSRKAQRVVKGIDEKALPGPSRRLETGRRRYSALPTRTTSKGAYDEDE